MAWKKSWRLSHYQSWEKSWRQYRTVLEAGLETVLDRILSWTLSKTISRLFSRLFPILSLRLIFSAQYALSFISYGKSGGSLSFSSSITVKSFSLSSVPSLSSSSSLYFYSTFFKLSSFSITFLPLPDSPYLLLHKLQRAPF